MRDKRTPNARAHALKVSNHLVFFLNLGTTIFGVFYSMFLARTFGMGRDIECYFAASALYISLSKMLQIGSLSAIFVPLYHRIQEQQGKSVAFDSFGVVINSVAMITIGVVTLGFFASNILVNLRVPGFSGVDLEQVLQLFRALLPLVLLDAVAAFVLCLVHAERRFGRAEGVVSAATVLQLVGASLFVDAIGIWALVVGLYVASLIRLCGFSAIAFKVGYRHRMLLRVAEFRSGQLFTRMGLTGVYSVVTQLFLFAFDAAISMLTPGSFALFRYIQKLTSVTQGLLMKPIRVVFFNHISASFSRGIGENRTLIRGALGNALMYFSIALVFVFVSLEDILLIALGGSEFPETAIQTVSESFRLMMIGIGLVVYQQIVIKTVLASGLVTRLYIGMILCQIATWGFLTVCVPHFSLSIAITVIIFNAAILGFVPGMILWKLDSRLLCFFRFGDILRATLFVVFGVIFGLQIRFYFDSLNETIVIRAILTIASTGVFLVVIGSVLRFQEFDAVARAVWARVSKKLSM